MTNKVYDLLKDIAGWVLPIAATLYSALSSIWGFPYTEQIVGTITAIEAALYSYLKYQKKKYEGDGILEVNTTDPNADVFQLAFNTTEDISKLPEKKFVTFKVVDTSQK